jgi:hypothetical protein
MGRHPKDKTLSEYPELLSQWHPTLNAEFKHYGVVIEPSKIAAGSNKKAWWKCPVADDHVWEAVIGPRALRNIGCPCCSGRQASITNSLESLFPNVAAEWHLEKNDDILPNDVPAGTEKKYWWQCGICENEWEAAPSERTACRGGTGCPPCGVKKRAMSKSTPKAGQSLGDLFPDISSQWHKELNGNLSPYDVMPGTAKKVWWKCPVADDHVWEAVIHPRTRHGVGCPSCSGHQLSVTNSIAYKLPEIVNEWHPTMNGDLTPSEVIAGSHKKYWWKCNTCSHEWDAAPGNRMSGTGCPPCSILRGHQILGTPESGQSAGELYPRLLEEWHPQKNGDKTAFDFKPKSNQDIWWKCKQGHEWVANMAARTDKGSGCPYCANVFVSGENNLAVVRPDAVSYWHPELNGELIPEQIIANSAKICWWKCPVADDHEWQASPNTVLRALDAPNDLIGCPMCKGRNTVLSNCVATTHGELLDEWDSEMNEPITPYDITIGSAERIWWRCSQNLNHRWATTCHNKIVRNTGCPSCAILGFDPSKPGYYYVNKILNADGEIIYFKAGISGDWVRRLSELSEGLPEGYSIENLDTMYFENGHDAKEIESKMIRFANENGFKAPPRDFPGGHELFLSNPLDYLDMLEMQENN